MKKIIQLILGVVIVNMSFATSIKADEIFGDTKLESSNLRSSQAELEKDNASFSYYEGILTYSSESVTAFSQMDNAYGWNTPEFGGEGEWEGTGGNPVGGDPVPASISDTTFPILLSMFFIYFLYRGVSSKKRKSI